jgi:hypothetical protein
VLPEGSIVWPVLASLLKQYDLNEANKTTSVVLHGQRDYLCKYLKRKKAIQTVTGFESLFVCVLNGCVLQLLIPLHHFRPGLAN